MGLGDDSIACNGLPNVAVEDLYLAIRILPGLLEPCCNLTSVQASHLKHGENDRPAIGINKAIPTPPTREIPVETSNCPRTLDSMPCY